MVPGATQADCATAPGGNVSPERLKLRRAQHSYTRRQPEDLVAQMVQTLAPFMQCDSLAST